MFSYVLLSVCAYFLSGFLLRKESVQRYQIFKQSFYIIMVFVFAFLFKENGATMTAAVGIVFIIIGLYLVDGDNSSPTAA